jgi:hypothetical protein
MEGVTEPKFVGNVLQRPKAKNFKRFQFKKANMNVS